MNMKNNTEAFKKDLLELFVKYGVFDVDSEAEVKEILNDENNEFFMENVYNLLEGIG